MSNTEFKYLNKKAVYCESQPSRVFSSFVVGSDNVKSFSCHLNKKLIIWINFSFISTFRQ